MTDEVVTIGPIIDHPVLPNMHTPTVTTPVPSIITLPPPIDTTNSPVEPPWKYANRGSSTKVMVVSSKKTGQLRRVIQCDNDIEYMLWESRAHPGENILYMTTAQYDSFENRLSDFKTHVAKKAGHKKASDDSVSRLAHIDPDGNVINIIHGDLSCGDHIDWHGEGHLLKHHPNVEIGWKYIKEKNELVQQ